MLQGFKIKVLNDNTYPTTLSFRHDVENCSNLECLTVQITNTYKPGVGWFELYAVFRDPDPTNPTPLLEVKVTTVRATVGFGKVKEVLS